MNYEKTKGIMAALLACGRCSAGILGHGFSNGGVRH
jgi:hypothetical protein